jgi:hypothetical protein
MKAMICVVLAATGFASAAAAKDHDYQKGVLLQMESVHCGSSSSSAKSLAGEVIGTDSGKTKTQEVLCQEYVLQADHVIYHIRPKDDKHPALLPIGETAEFRIDKDKILLRVPEGDGKEHEYTVVAMTPRSDNNSSPSAKNQ